MQGKRDACQKRGMVGQAQFEVTGSLCAFGLCPSRRREVYSCL